MQSGHQSTHDHHLSPDILQVHAQQSRVARTQAEELTRPNGTAHHPRFFHSHPLGNTGGAGSLHFHRRRRREPFRQKGINGPQSLIFLFNGQRGQFVQVCRRETPPLHADMLPFNLRLPHTTNNLSGSPTASARCR